MMKPEQQLVAVGTVQVEAVERDGVPFANLRRLCEDLGLAYGAQFRKLQSQRWATVLNMRTVGNDGKQREMAFISADSIPLWLATINANKVHPDIRPALHVIQDEAKDVLYQHFAKPNQNAVVSLDLVMKMQTSITELQTGYAKLVGEFIANQQIQNEQFAELMRYVRRIDERTKGKREGFSLATKRLFLAVVEAKYRGYCPCCRDVQIVCDGKRVSDISQNDHWHHRSMNNPEHGWLVCKSCNRKLRDRKPRGFWHNHSPMFHAFQISLDEYCNGGDQQLELPFK